MFAIAVIYLFIIAAVISNAAISNWIICKCITIANTLITYKYIAGGTCVGLQKHRIINYSEFVIIYGSCFRCLHNALLKFAW